MLETKLTASVTTDCLCENEDGSPSPECFDCYEWQKEDVFELLGLWQLGNDVTEDDKILITGTGMTWRKLSGWKETDILELHSALSLDGDFRIEWYLEDNVLTARRWSHDEPTGTGLFEFKVFKKDRSKCCDAVLVPDLEPEVSHSWEDVANANLVCEVCGE